MHRWEQTLFEANSEFEGLMTCVDTFSCKLCGETVRVPHGIKPESSAICEDKQRLIETVSEFKKSLPIRWENGKKPRGNKNADSGKMQQVQKGRKGEAIGAFV